MDYLSKEYFQRYYRDRQLNEQRLFSDSINHQNINDIFDIFLSYNFDDQTVVKGIYEKLSSMGFSVYLDCIVDRYMERSMANSETAWRIRTRLLHCRSLLYAQSENAFNSNWMPWELGVADGHTNGKCMIMPLVENANKYTPQREYTALYPMVKLNKYGVLRVDNNTIVGLSLRDYILY